MKRSLKDLQFKMHYIILYHLNIKGKPKHQSFQFLTISLAKMSNNAGVTEIKWEAFIWVCDVNIAATVREDPLHAE